MSSIKSKNGVLTYEWLSPCSESTPDHTQQIGVVCHSDLPYIVSTFKYRALKPG